MWEALISAGAALGGLGFVGTVITAFAMRRKVRAEADKTGADAASVLTGSAVSWAKEIRADLDNTQAELRALRRHVGLLEGLLQRNGIPVPEFAWPPAG